MLVIWEDKYNRILFEDGEINTYVKKIFGNGWEFVETLRSDVDIETARSMRMTLDMTLNKKKGE